MPILERIRSESRIPILQIVLLFLLAVGLVFTDSSWGEDVISIGNIRIDKVKKEIRVNARVALAEGILEYLLVCDEGKTYESAFKLGGNKASELNFALLLIGCEPLDFATFMKLREEEQGLASLLRDHKSSVVEIDLYKGGRKAPFGHLIRNREGSDQPLAWVYTGGFFTGNRNFSADLEFSLIGLWPDETALISLFSKAGNPYRGNFGFEMNKQNAPPELNQPYEIVIRRKGL